MDHTRVIFPMKKIRTPATFFSSCAISCASIICPAMVIQSCRHRISTSSPSEGYASRTPIVPPDLCALTCQFLQCRYSSSHGVLGNDDNARLDEKMIADYLQPLGYRSAVVGKTHVHKDLKELSALDLDPDSPWCRAHKPAASNPMNPMKACILILYWPSIPARVTTHT